MTNHLPKQRYEWHTGTVVTTMTEKMDSNSIIPTIVVDAVGGGKISGMSWRRRRRLKDNGEDDVLKEW